MRILLDSTLRAGEYGELLEYGHELCGLLAPASPEEVLAAAHEQGQIIITRNAEYDRLIAAGAPACGVVFIAPQEEPEREFDVLRDALAEHREALAEGATVIIEQDGIATVHEHEAQAVEQPHQDFDAYDTFTKVLRDANEEKKRADGKQEEDGDRRGGGDRPLTGGPSLKPGDNEPGSFNTPEQIRSALRYITVEKPWMRAELRDMIEKELADPPAKPKQEIKPTMTPEEIRAALRHIVKEQPEIRAQLKDVLRQEFAELEKAPVLQAPAVPRQRGIVREAATQKGPPPRQKGIEREKTQEKPKREKGIDRSDKTPPPQPPPKSRERGRGGR
jgi:predicted nuclease of predicted toxin-antitoxin system